ANGAGHGVQVIAVVSRRGGDHVIAARNQDEIIVAGADRDIEGRPPTPTLPRKGGGRNRGEFGWGLRVDPLKGEALLRVEPGVLELLERPLHPRVVLVVLVGRVGRPVAGGG